MRSQHEQLRAELAELRHALAPRAPRTSPLAGALQHASGLDADEGGGREHAMREVVDLLRTLVEAAPMLLFVKDAEGRYMLANGYFLRWVGLTWDEVAGKTDHELFPKERADAFRASDIEAMTTGRPLAWEDSDTGADGQLRHFAVTKFPLRDPAGALRGVCGISTDISSYKRAEEENRQLQAVILTGIQPKIAQTLVELGVDLSSLVTRGTLESGIAHVLDR
ncbi:PAS domain-containing protein [Sorangium sp. So ce321]|uniref:PAS domain-containing protein n=1 Tax=Sorangium sp. So ce321 TaxID=3133300 RepID=UPI003F5D9F6A